MRLLQFVVDDQVDAGPLLGSDMNSSIIFYVHL